jgi:hypothetical protein
MMVKRLVIVDNPALMSARMVQRLAAALQRCKKAAKTGRRAE